jgi:hypothetical protein
MALALALIPVSNAFALTSQDVNVTATPAFISISNAPGTWTINGITGSGVIAPNTTYYSNPLGDTVSPTVGGVVDGECRFTITNTSTVAIDLTVTFPDHANGDASTNSNLGTNDTTKFGAKSYFTGQLSGAWVIAKNGTPVSGFGYTNLAATTNIKWGLMYISQSNAWTSGTAMTSTVNITATLH